MRKVSRRHLLLGAAAALPLAPARGSQASDVSRWSEEQAEAWYKGHRWLLGCNFIPSSAVNTLEMWQVETFDLRGIDRELGWAAGLGMNVARVFLHDLAWHRDPDGFRRRFDTLLTVASGHGMTVLPVLFDSCWDPFPRVGSQAPPVPGVHNSRWVQSPGAAALQDPSQIGRLRAYVTALVGSFGNDDRILGWDIWNEPDNLNSSSYGQAEPPGKLDFVLTLLPQAFAWARSSQPRQPLTSGVWQGDWLSDAGLSPIERIQLTQSDVISFHSYGPPDEFEVRVASLRRFRRPIFCTEYMARPLGSTFERIAPLAKQLDVGVVNWGLVAGRTQTWLPWDSWQRPYVGVTPPVWFHDVFHMDGRAYRPEEAAFLRHLMAV